jgi:hypothetical protein
MSTTYIWGSYRVVSYNMRCSRGEVSIDVINLSMWSVQHDGRHCASPRAGASISFFPLFFCVILFSEDQASLICDIYIVYLNKNFSDINWVKGHNTDYTDTVKFGDSGTIFKTVITVNDCKFSTKKYYNIVGNIAKSWKIEISQIC